MHLNGLAILSRYFHVITACMVIGCVFFLRVLLPIGTRGIDPETLEAVSLRSRRAVKMVIHAGTLLLLASGIYNAVGNWKTYTQYPRVLHGIFGVHLLLALSALALLMVAFAGRAARRSSGGLTRWALVLLFLAVAAASTLKAGREYAMLHPTKPVDVAPSSVAR